MRERKRRGRWSSAVFGLVIVGAGIAFLLDQLDLIDVGNLFSLWPLLLVAIGLGHFADGKAVSGSIWIALGGWFLAWSLGYTRISPFDGWAIVPILIGLSLIRTPMLSRSGSGRDVHLAAVMAGNAARLRGSLPGGIVATAVMGGVEIDLRSLDLPEDRRVPLLVTTIWGGTEIRIPAEWSVENRMLPILADVATKGVAAPETSGTLVLEGVAVMGGVEIRYPSPGEPRLEW